MAKKVNFKHFCGVANRKLQALIEKDDFETIGNIKHDGEILVVDIEFKANKKCSIDAFGKVNWL
jgi:hypothetical protein